MQYVVRTRNNNLNIRSGPGQQYHIVGSLQRGTRVDIIASQDQWKKLGSGGWVHNDYLVPASAGNEEVAPEVDLVLPHYRWPHDQNRRMLAGFGTGQASLKPEHIRWLLRHAAPRARAGQWIFLRGYASKLGDTTINRQLSIRRANAVRKFLITQAGVSSRRITGSGGIGEEWSQGSERDNSAQWRAVEVIISDGVIQGPQITIIGDSPLSRQFFIKYLGGGGGGPGFALGVHGFMIRNPSNWYIRYGLGTAGGSIGAPFSLGNRLPPGRGWVSFSTTSQRTVDSFGGRAYLRQSGVQIGSHGFGFFKLFIPGVLDINIPTGSGLSASLYDVGGGPFDPDIDGPSHDNIWRYT